MLVSIGQLSVKVRKEKHQVIQAVVSNDRLLRPERERERERE